MPQPPPPVDTGLPPMTPAKAVEILSGWLHFGLGRYDPDLNEALRMGITALITSDFNK